MKKSDRNPDGTFKHGNSVQQDILKGRVTWAKRVEQLDAKYDTLEKLLQLFEKDPNTGNLRPNAELRSRHPRDVAIIMQSLNAILGDDKRLERESFWDRFEGKPQQSVEMEFNGTLAITPLVRIMTDEQQIIEQEQQIIEHEPSQPTH